jgi:hypothetical protein
LLPEFAEALVSGVVLLDGVVLEAAADWSGVALPAAVLLSGVLVAEVLDALFCAMVSDELGAAPALLAAVLSGPVLLGLVPEPGVVLGVALADVLEALRSCSAELEPVGCAAVALPCEFRSLEVPVGAVAPLLLVCPALAASSELTFPLLSLSTLEPEVEPELLAAVVAALESEAVEAVLLLQLSETMLTLSTLMELLAVSREPLTWMVWPTCALRSSVLPFSDQLFPAWSVME